MWWDTVKPANPSSPGRMAVKLTCAKDWLIFMDKFTVCIAECNV